MGQAHDQALAENNIWEKIRRSGAWQIMVAVATVVVIVAAIAAFFLTGPIALIAGLIATVAGALLAINDVLEWRAGMQSGWQAALSVLLTVIPGGLLLKAGKSGVTVVSRVGMSLAPKLTTAITANMRALGASLGTALTRLRRLGASPSAAINQHIPEAITDGLSALQRSKLDMYDRLIARHSDSPLLQRLFDGSRFNWERAGHFDFNEVSLARPGGGRPTRVDSYSPGGEVVSRKATQLAQVQENTALGYIDEAVTKYGPRTDGITIADTPANRTKLGDQAGKLIGEQLEGQLVLEVPIQDAPIPQTILDHAAIRGVEIRQVPRVR